MKRFTILSYTISGFLFFTACKSNNPTENTSTEIFIEDTIPPFVLSQDLEKILCSEKQGILRGAYLGMSKEDVSKNEDTLSIVSDNPGSVTYTLTYNDNEDADIQYNFSHHGIVVGIQTVIYPHGEKEQKEIFEELTSYFTYKYGTPSTANTDEVIWKVKLEEFEIKLKKQGNVKVHDIQLEISPIVNTPTALSQK